MNFFYTFSTLLFIFVYIAGFLYSLELNEFDIRSINVSRNEAALTDTFDLTVLNVSSCKILLNVASENVRGSCELTGNVVSSDHSFCLLRCRCLETESSFVVSERKCVEERKFRVGCQYVFGSWSWRNGWTWDNREDPLPILDIRSYGITTALNASSRVYNKCEVTSLDKYDTEGLWEALDPVFFQGGNVVFFKLLGMWHFTWVISELNSSRRNEIEGRFIRINVKCTQNNVIGDNVLTNDFSSCVVLKITGNVTHYYKSNRNNTENGSPKSTTEDSSNILSNTWALVGIIGGGVLLFAWIAVVYFLYGRKCFKFKATVQTESSVKYNCNTIDLPEQV